MAASLGRRYDPKVAKNPTRHSNSPPAHWRLPPDAAVERYGGARTAPLEPLCATTPSGSPWRIGTLTSHPAHHADDAARAFPATQGPGAHGDAAALGPLPTATRFDEADREDLRDRLRATRAGPTDPGALPASSLSKPEGVAVGIVEPGATRGTHVGDVAGGGEGTFGVVQELDALGLQVLDGGLDVVDLEVGQGVLRGDWRPLEDRDLADGPAAVAAPAGVADKGVRASTSP